MRALAILETYFHANTTKKWSGEIFIVLERRLKGGLPIYRLKHYINEEIKRSFY